MKIIEQLRGNKLAMGNDFIVSVIAFYEKNKFITIKQRNALERWDEGTERLHMYEDNVLDYEIQHGDDWGDRQ